MDIAKNEIKLTGVNRIIFDYCHFPLIFEDELKEKTKLIYKILNVKNIDFDEHVDVYINDSGKWFLGYPADYIRFSGKLYITDELADRKFKYGEIMGFGEVEGVCNECYLCY